MSTREYAHTLLDRLTDNQLDYLVMMLENGFPEPPNSVDSVEEIDALLAEAEESIKAGRVYTAAEVDEHLRERYGI